MWFTLYDAMLTLLGGFVCRCGTPGFVAPEILAAGKGEAYPSGVDMFSAGVVAYTMLCGYEPFFGVNDEELIQMNKLVESEFEEPEWSSISDEAKDLVRSQQ
jgi:calcium/calmodulin-dependent protein kinase-4